MFAVLFFSYWVRYVFMLSFTFLWALFFLYIFFFSFSSPLGKNLIDVSRMRRQQPSLAASRLLLASINRLSSSYCLQFNDENILCLLTANHSRNVNGTRILVIFSSILFSSYWLLYVVLSDECTAQSVTKSKSWKIRQSNVLQRVLCFFFSLIALKLLW